MEKKLIKTHRDLEVYLLNSLSLPQFFSSSSNLFIIVYSRETIPFSIAKVVRA